MDLHILSFRPPWHLSIRRGGVPAPVQSAAPAQDSPVRIAVRTWVVNVSISAVVV
jgi:hypothetical protein